MFGIPTPSGDLLDAPLGHFAVSNNTVPKGIERVPIRYQDSFFRDLRAPN
jgi:hypothetical protein